LFSPLHDEETRQKRLLKRERERGREDEFFGPTINQKKRRIERKEQRKSAVDKSQKGKKNSNTRASSAANSVAAKETNKNIREIDPLVHPWFSCA